MEQNIFEVIEKLRRTEEDLYTAKEALKNKEDSLYLYADWNALKEQGITNQRQRDAHVREITRKHRDKVSELEILVDYLKRVYYVLSREQQSLNPAVEPVGAK